MSAYRTEYLDAALACGAVLTGTPDGSEAITVVFTIEAWRAFDLAQQAPQPVQQPAAVVNGWATEDGERVVSASTMDRARRDGGATLSGLRPYSVPLYTAPVPAAGMQGDDPMDWPLPCDVTVGHGTHKKGAPLRSLVARMNVLFNMSRNGMPDSGRDADWRVAEFWSSANPKSTVLCLACHRPEFDEWPKRSDFIRWVSPAAHPAPSSDAATMRGVIALAWKWHREAVSLGFACSEPAQELFELLGWPNADAAHPANGAQAGLSDDDIKAVAINYASHVADDIYDVTKYDCAEDFFDCVRAILAAAKKGTLP